MAFNVVQEIRKKSRESWRETLWEKVTDLRIWIQENGELGFILAIISGILLATFFKVFAFLLAIAVIVAFGIYLLALPESELHSIHFSSDKSSGELHQDSNNSLNGVDQEMNSTSSESLSNQEKDPF